MAKAVFLKAIKPVEFKSDAIDRELRKAAREAGEWEIKEFERVTTGWSGERPEWTLRAYSTKKEIGVIIALRNENSLGAKKWQWLDKGTKPHIIRPVKAKQLAFRTPYNAGSIPGVIRTFKSSQPAGAKLVFAQVVHHPGTKARGWSAILRKDAQKVFERYMSAAMIQGAKASGHYIA